MNNTTQYTQSSTSSEFKQYLYQDKVFGYIHEFKRIPNIEQSRYVIKVSVPLGNSRTGIYYEIFELYIKDADALMTFMDNKDHINNEDVKTTVRFKCGSLRSHAYIAENGERAGQAISYMRGNLTYLLTMKVEGDTVHGFQDRELGVVDRSTGEIKTPGKQGNNVSDTASESSEKPNVDDVPVDACTADVDSEGEKSAKSPTASRSRKPAKKAASQA